MAANRGLFGLPPGATAVTNGMSPVADAEMPGGRRWDISMAGPGALRVPTNYVGTYLPPTFASTISVFNSNPQFGLMYVPEDMMFDRMVLKVGNTGTSREMKLGIWAPNFVGTNGVGRLPGTLLVESGAIGTDTTGLKSATISVRLKAGWYWSGIFVNNTTTVHTSDYGGPCLAYDGNDGFYTGIYANISYPADGLPSNINIAGYNSKRPLIALRILG